MHPLQYTQAVIASAGTTMTTNRQVITTSFSNFPQQILPSLVPSSNHQPVIIRQYGTAATQQSLGNFRHEAVARNWKEKPYIFPNQLPVVRPNSFYASVVPVHSSQIFNSHHIGEISSQPQIIMAQESGTMLNQAQLQGLQTVNALPPRLSWTPGFHPYQNSFVLCNQPTGMTLQQIRPQMTMQPAPATALPIPTATSKIVAPVTKKKLKELKPKEKIIKQLSSTGAQLKSVAGNPNLAHIVNGQTKSTGIESKSASVENEISLPEKTEAAVPFSDIQKASIAPTVDNSAVPMTPLIIGSCAGTSPFPTNPEMVSVNSEINQAPSTSVALSDVVNKTYPNQEQVVNDCTKSTGIESKTMSESELLPRKKSEASHFSEISQACIASTINVSEPNSDLPTLLSTDANPFPSSIQRTTILAEMNQVPCIPISQPKSKNICSNLMQSTKDLMKSTGVENKPVSAEANIFSHQKSPACYVPAPTVNASVISMAPSNLSLITTSSISSIVSTNSVPAVSAVPPFSCVSNKELSDFDTKPLSSKALNKAVVTSHQTNAKDSVATDGPLEPQPLIQKLSLEPVKKKPQIATVKPQIVTHIIDGFIIEESSEPLPVIRSPFLDSPCKVLPSLKLNSPSPEKRENSLRGRHGRKRKRFRGRKCLQKQILAEDKSTSAIPDEEILPASEDESIVSYKSDKENSAPFDNFHDTPMELNKLSDEVGLLKSKLSEKLPGKWTVQDVFEFLQNLSGYSEYADNFKSQEVDGQALLLLNENHLQTSLCMKLGPALKLMSQIKSIEKKLQLQLQS